MKLQPGILLVECSACGMTRLLATAKLVLGIEHDPNIIVLPPCPCGTPSRVFLNRTLDHIEPGLLGTPFDNRRRLINALSEELRTAGRVHPIQRSTIEQSGTPIDLP